MENYQYPPQLSEATPEDIERMARDYAAQGRILNILLDIVFKDVFSYGSDDSQTALKSLLSACIRREVSGVHVANSEIAPEYLRGKTVRLNDLVEIIFYELPKLEEKVGRVLEGVEGVENLSLEEKWCIYLKYHEDEGKSPLIKKLCLEEAGIMSAEKVLNKVSADYEEWARALFREKADMDYRSGMGNAYRRGVKEGEAQAEARVQAVEQRAEAQVQAAKAQVQAAAIRKMREMGVAEDIIAASFPDGGGA